MIEELRESMQSNAGRQIYWDELFNALESSNYEIARFILIDNPTTVPRNDPNVSNYPDYFRRYIRTEEYKFGGGYELAERLFALGGGYYRGAGFTELMPGSFRPDFLDAIMEPHYTRDAASIFGDDDAEAYSAENVVLVYIAENAAYLDTELPQVSFVICKWFLTKLIEFSPGVMLNAARLNGEEDEPDVTRASNALYDALEFFVRDVYLAHARDESASQRLENIPIDELVPLLCEAARVSSLFHLRLVGSTLINTGLDVMSICAPPPMAVAEVTTDLTDAIAGAAADAELVAPAQQDPAFAMPPVAEVVVPPTQPSTDEEEGRLVANVMPAAPVVRREEIPAYARFSDPEETGVRIPKPPFPPFGGGGTLRRRRTARTTPRPRGQPTSRRRRRGKQQLSRATRPRRK
jgi:hypothetical protein